MSIINLLDKTEKFTNVAALVATPYFGTSCLKEAVGAALAASALSFDNSLAKELDRLNWLVVGIGNSFLKVNLKEIGLIGVSILAGIYGYKNYLNLDKASFGFVKSGILLGGMAKLVQENLFINSFYITFLKLTKVQSIHIRNIIRNVTVISLTAMSFNPIVAIAVAQIGSQILVKACEKSYLTYQSRRTVQTA